VILDNIVLFRYNDSAQYIRDLFLRYLFSGNTIKTANPISHYFDAGSNILFEQLVRYFHPIFVNNVFILFAVLISGLSFYKLVRKLIDGDKVVLVVFSLLYSISTYFLFRVTSFTVALYLTFFFPLILFAVIKKYNPLLIGILAFIILSFSNYYGFFCIILVYLWFTFGLIAKKSIKNYLKDILLFSLPVLLGVLTLFLPLIKDNLSFSKEYRRENSQNNSADRTVVYRPLEDWYNLSFRPWYFFIPPKSSVFFGEFSKNIHEKIENTGYYLADDYMEEEMAGSYMGWHFLLGLGTVATLLLLKKFKNKEFKTFKTVYENKEMIIRSFFIIFCILLISGPPSFTISGVEIFTPSYLLYYIIPVFRTLVRWAVVIYLFVLIINSFLVQDLFNLMRTKFQKILFILAFVSLNFVIFAIKIPVININKPPEEIVFVKEKYPESVPHAVYPKGDYYSIFWIISHEDLLINPVNFVNYETGFDSNEFSKNLITPEGIQEFLTHNPRYLIYYPDNISDDDLEKITKVNPTLTSREEIYGFFKSEFGEGTKVGESVVFDIGD